MLKMLLNILAAIIVCLPLIFLLGCTCKAIYDMPSLLLLLAVMLVLGWAFYGLASIGNEE